MTLQEIGSKEGFAPSSARRNAASPIKGTALQRLLEAGLAFLLLPVWRSGMTFRSVCFAAGGLPDTRLGLHFERVSGKPPGLRLAGFSSGCCPDD